MPTLKHAWPALWFLAACSTAHFTTTPPPPARVEHTDQAGARILVLARPTPGLCRLSLFIDAGSRDANPPQAATAAAWLAAEHSGADVEALVYPDLTELSRSCETADLERCISQLGRALAFRAPTAAQIVAIQARLEATRRRALAADPDRPADMLAATALLGDAGAGFFPFGRAEDDPQLTAASVDQLLRNHYGPRRVLLVAAGDVPAERVRELAAGMFATAPSAAAIRSERSLEPEAEPDLLSRIDERNVVGVALAGGNESELRAQVHALSERLLDGATLRGHVFAVRGGALALLRISGDPWQLLPRAARELVRLQLEPSPPSAAHASADDLASISRAQGLAFGAYREQPPSTATSARAFAVGLLLTGDRGAGPRARAQLERQERATLDRAASVFRSALATAEPRTSGDTGEFGASVATENGARIDVQYAHGPYVAIAVRIAYGAEQDPPDLHGRSALLASLTASACAGLGPERLGAELARIGAALEPRVSAESYGIALRAPREQWEPAVDLALRCARTPSRDAAHIAAAAVRLQTRLATGGAALAAQLRVANQLAPRAPGMIAPWGDPGRIGDITARDVLDALRASDAGVRWGVSVVGEVPIAEATARVARRVADMNAGALPKSVQPGQLESVAFSIPDALAADAISILATWDARGEYGNRLGAAVFASALHAILALTPGIEVSWQEAETYPAGAWAALRLRVSAELVPRLAAKLGEIAANLETVMLEEALTRGVGLAQEAESADAGEASVRAEHLVRSRLGARVEAPSLDSARELLMALRKSPVRLSVIR